MLRCWTNASCCGMHQIVAHRTITPQSASASILARIDLESHSTMVSGGNSSARHRPGLSHDKISAQFAVDTWTPRGGRFVLWYYCTTTLSHPSIAIARNATFPDEEPEMDERDVHAIVETILDDRWQLIEPQLSPGGHFPKPTRGGWAPCDHGMCCSRVARSVRRTSVMRSPNIRTRRDQDVADKATKLWQGTWDELLSCSREHSASSDGSSALSSEPLSSEKENRNFFSRLFSSSASIAPSQGTQGQRQHSNHPGQRSWSSLSSSKIIYDPTSPNPSEEDRLLQLYNQRSSASSRSGASRRSVRANRTPPEPAVPVEVNHQDDESPIPVREGGSRQSTRFLPNIQASWFVLRNTIAMISCIVVLDPTFEFLCANLHRRRSPDLSWPTLRRGFELSCTLGCVWRLIDAAFGILERWYWSRWSMEASPPQMPLLSSTTEMACGAVACTITAFVCYHLSLSHAWYLCNEVLLLLLPHQNPAS